MVGSFDECKHNIFEVLTGGNRWGGANAQILHVTRMFRRRIAFISSELNGLVYLLPMPRVDSHVHCEDNHRMIRFITFYILYSFSLIQSIRLFTARSRRGARDFISYLQYCVYERLLRTTYVVRTTVYKAPHAM